MFLDKFPYEKFGVGFDSIEETRRNLLEQIRANTTSYPPYNIRKTSETEYVIEIAAAGFSIDAFDITLEDEFVRVKCTPPVEAEANFIHRGLTNKSWTREFVLNNGVKVVSASLTDGLLRINLEYEQSPKKKTVKISIDGRDPKVLHG